MARKIKPHKSWKIWKDMADKIGNPEEVENGTKNSNKQ
jgi:NAD-dependent oxidoreductase involved in siderophore biosynthesis